eukprot:PhF_6_TR10601/c0_g1_i4/m.17075
MGRVTGNRNVFVISPLVAACGLVQRVLCVCPTQNSGTTRESTVVNAQPDSLGRHARRCARTVLIVPAMVLAVAADVHVSPPTTLGTGPDHSVIHVSTHTPERRVRVCARTGRHAAVTVSV